MSNLFTHPKTIKLIKRKYVASFILSAFLIISSFCVHAQNVLIGLTSNGSIEGKGTAFTINTNGNNFSVMKGFTDWGNTPNGSLFKNDDGNFYGMTSRGGTNNDGTIFKMTPNGKMTMLKQLYYTQDGAYPDGELVKGNDGYLYGLTSAGGANSYGTIFKISASGSNFSVIKHLNFATDGANPHGHLTLASDGNFYGITYSGGTNGGGTIFKLTADGKFSVIYSLNKATEGGNSYSSLTVGADGNLYGTTYGGGTNSNGTIFKITTGGKFTVVRQLNGATDGSYPQSDLLLASDGSLYGTCSSGGQFGSGTIFKISTGVYSVVKNFSPSTDGGAPYGGLMQNTDGNFYGITRIGGTKGGGTIYKLTTGGAYSVIHPLDYTNEGNTSSSVLARGNDGSLYAMTSLGGAFNYGIIFKTTTGGDFTLMNTFNGATLGNAPYSSFVIGKDNAYYCTMSAGGAYGFGSIVKICGGEASVFFSFDKTKDGGYPKGDLLLASDGNFYGMASDGGKNNVGTIFRITPDGTYSVLRNLTAATDGAAPVGGLIQAKDGLLYGMTSGGGANNAGTIFKMKLDGSNFTVIKTFVFANDGGAPLGKLLQASDGNFYGMTSNGGHIFQLTQAGGYSNLHTFNSSLDGYNPFGSLIQASDGNLYGTCSDGGTKSSGTIFQMSLGGNFKVIRNLDAVPDGRMPKGSLLQGNDGFLYGMTSIGGTYNTGTIFKIATSGNNFSVLHHMNIETDGGNAYGSLIFAVNLIAYPQTVDVNEDSSVKITLTSSGTDPLTYTVVTNPGHGKLTGTAPKLTYKPNKNYNGTDQFSFIVTKGCMVSDAGVITINVKPMPDSPVLAPIGNQTVKADSLLKFKAKATDVDSGQTITYSLIGAPAGAKINKSTGVFTWTPTAAGTYSFKVRATDNDTPPLYDEEKITVTVTHNFAGNISNAQATTAVKASVFPNPVTDVLHIRLQTQVDDLIVKVLSLNGAVISTYDFHNTGKTNCDVNVSKLNSGMYILQLQSDQINETLKFMKN
ncbi:MAG: T9SS type A sorting domain-containing protein [Parafilimonas sp.]|nr:T9SS type A sorting domain-containing protein [Parafilimonas sp.]